MSELDKTIEELEKEVVAELDEALTANNRILLVVRQTLCQK